MRLKIVGAVALLVIAVRPAMGAWEWPRGLQRQVEKAYELQEQGKDEEAIKLLNDLVAGTTPLGQARVYASIAELEQRTEHHAEAQAAYEKALALNALSPAERFDLTQKLDDEYLRAADHERGRALLQSYLTTLDETASELPTDRALVRRSLTGPELLAAIYDDGDGDGNIDIDIDLKNSRETIEAGRSAILFRLARHDGADGKTLDASAHIDAAIASHRRPHRIWREYKVELLCSSAERVKCVDSIVELARTGRMRSTKAEELDGILKGLADDPNVQPALETARAQNLISGSNEIVWRLPPGYLEAVPVVRFYPPYPRKALRDRVSGVVDVDFRIDPDGRPRDVKIVFSDPPGVFDSVVLQVFSRWRYEPAIVYGKPVASRSIERLAFRPDQ